jgi:hypothetical protein
VEHKFQSVLDGDHRDPKASSIAEGFNNAFCLSLPACRTDWYIMERFQMEESMSKASLQQAAIGDLAQTPKVKGVNRRGKGDQLRNLVLNFRNMSLKDYLECVIYFFE